MKKERNIAFIVELLLLFMILLFVIVVITQTFMKSRSQSLYARHLTEAVTLAEEVAEVSASAEDLTEAAERLGAMEQVLEIRKLQPGQGAQETQELQEMQGNQEPQETQELQGESEARPEAAEGLVMAMEFAAENGTRDDYRVELEWVEENESIASAEGTSGGDAAVDRVSAGDTEAEVDLEPETGAAAGGRFVTKQIRVYFADEQEPIYTLDAGDLKEA